MLNIIMVIMVTMTVGNADRMTVRMGIIMLMSIMFMMLDANDDANGDHLVMISVIIAVSVFCLMTLAIMIR